MIFKMQWSLSNNNSIPKSVELIYETFFSKKSLVYTKLPKFTDTDKRHVIKELKLKFLFYNTKGANVHWVSG